MAIDQIINNINLEFLIYWLVKIVGIIGSVLYLIFTLVLIKQTGVMKKTIEINDKNILTTIALIQFFLAVFLIIDILFFI